MTGSRSLPLLATALVVALSTSGCGGQDQPSGSMAEMAQPSGPFSTDRPTVGHLDPELLSAVSSAAVDASRDGVGLKIVSGWRSRAHQQRLFDEAVAEYGSEEEARRYVSTPDTSAHVTGDAVDIGPTDADDWLDRHGATYGLCQVFANEIWHFELATEPGGRCPPMLPDSSYR